MAVEAAKQTRGEGPVAINYVDAEGKAHRRVPMTGAGLSIVPKGAEQGKVYNLTDLPESVKLALMLSGAGNRIKTYITNHGNPDGSDAVSLADEIWADFVAGKLYSRVAGEGGSKAGRQFDGSIYAEAWRAAFAAMAKKGLKKKDGSAIVPLTDDQVLDMQTKLETMSTKESTGADGKTIPSRTQVINAYKQNAFFLKAFNDLKAKSVKTTSEVGELPF